jgi:imidazolonepropionase
MKKQVEIIVANSVQVVTLDPRHDAPDLDDSDAAGLGIINNGAVAIDSGRIVDVGSQTRILDTYEGERIVDARGSVVTPGLVDPHTHLVFGGSRHHEFGMRMRGATYHEILEAGGGIHSTVAATRDAPQEELTLHALERLAAFLSFGVTTVEIKSGYGLDFDTELKILLVVKQLSEMQPIRLVPTYLGAHVVPKEYADCREAYVDLVVSKMLPEVSKRKLATACDVFLDEGAFTFEEAETILQAACELGIKPKIHAGQFTDQGGPELVARLGGLSADHLEFVSDEGIAAMAEGKVVANLLPGAAFSLRDHFPDGRRLIDGGVSVAVATDDNPGTSRTENLPLMASMAVTRMGLDCGEAMKAITVNAARACGLENEAGSIILGRRADIVVFSVPDFRSIFYHFGTNHATVVIADGRIAIEGLVK